MNEDIMELRAKFLRKEVEIIDGSDEDGNRGLVVGVTANSADPLTVLFSVYERAKHENYYSPSDVRLTGDVFVQEKPRDATVRCRRSRFDSLWRIIDAKGPHGVGSGTQGGAWAQYLAEVRQTPEKEKSNGEEVGVNTADKMADATSQINHVVGAADGCQLRDGLGLGKGPEQSDVAECDEAQGAYEANIGGLDQEVGEARAD